MKTDFNNLRKWRKVQVMLAIVVIVLGLLAFVELFLGKGGRIYGLSLNIVSLALAAVSFCVYRCSRCPYCGKSVMSGWTGKDGARRNCVRRITKRLPIICAHCGKEMDTNEE